jgi:hypothetical protein
MYIVINSSGPSLANRGCGVQVSIVYVTRALRKLLWAGSKISY